MDGTFRRVQVVWCQLPEQTGIPTVNNEMHTVPAGRFISFAQMNFRRNIYEVLFSFLCMQRKATSPILMQSLRELEVGQHLGQSKVET